MTIDPVQADSSVAVAQLRHQEAQLDVERRFANMLKGSGYPSDYAGDRQADDVKAIVRDVAEQLVAITFVQPMLEQMRSDPFKSDLFHGGMTEDMFGSQLDAILAQRIIAAGNFSVTESIYQQQMQRYTEAKSNDHDATRNKLDFQA